MAAPRPTAAPGAIDRALSRLARACTWGGVAAVTVMMLATCWDVLARQLLGRPLDGVVELVEVTVLAAAMLGLPEAFLRDEQIRVDLVDSLLPPRALAVVKALALALSVGFLALLVVRVWPPMLDARRYGDMKYDLGLPLWPLYALIVFAFAASMATAALSLMRALHGTTGAPASAGADARQERTA